MADNIQEHFRKKQYNNSSNLDARAILHQLYKTNPYDWFRWVYDHFQLADSPRILELGCGSGTLWVNNQDRIPVECELSLSDFSLGMVRKTGSCLSENIRNLSLLVSDAQDIPFPDQFFDIVIANHMLYHIKDRSQALKEIVRVLKPTGQFFASTVGPDHMHEIFTLGTALIPSLIEQSERYFSVQNFNLENGFAQLSPYLSNVQIDVYPDSLKVTSPEPLIAYILSIIDQEKANITDSKLTSFRDDLQDKIANQGYIKITKSTGLFSASKI